MLLKPLISICIPSYNHDKYVKEAIDSVLKQTYKNFELVIVDNCSTDNALKIIKSYNDSRIRLYQNETNTGGCEGTNQAVRLARGELIALLHTDDKYAPDFLEKIVEAYNLYPENKVFVTAVYHQDELLGHLTPTYPYEKEGIIPKKEAIIRLAYENNIGNGINVVIHKDALGKNDYYDMKYCISADHELFLRLAEDNEFVYINKLLTYYRMHDSNLTNRVFLEMVKEGYKICDESLSASKLISKELHRQLIRAQFKSMINKAFYIGFKYNQRPLTLDLLNFFRESYPELRHNPHWHLIYWLSFFINSFTSKVLTTPLKRLGRVYRTHTARNICKLAG